MNMDKLILGGNHREFVLVCRGCGKKDFLLKMAEIWGENRPKSANLD